jgi:hypothetical protein
MQVGPPFYFCSEAINILNWSCLQVGMYQVALKSLRWKFYVLFVWREVTYIYGTLFCQVLCVCKIRSLKEEHKLQVFAKEMHRKMVDPTRYKQAF